MCGSRRARDLFLSRSFGTNHERSKNGFEVGDYGRLTNIENLLHIFQKLFVAVSNSNLKHACSFWDLR
jgi:hypothetical protein